VKAGNRASACEELRAFIGVARQHEFAEIWVDQDHFPSLCALVHGQSAWMMYLRHDGDAGFSSRNVAYDGPRGLMMEFMLSNGQADEYPASWTYPADAAFDALVAFTRDGRVPDSIAWFNDSGDGASGPHDPC
jgi:hypothetical protein